MTTVVVSRPTDAPREDMFPGPISAETVDEYWAQAKLASEQPWEDLMRLRAQSLAMTDEEEEEPRACIRAHSETLRAGNRMLASILHVPDCLRDASEWMLRHLGVDLSKRQLTAGEYLLQALAEKKTALSLDLMVGKSVRLHGVLPRLTQTMHAKNPPKKLS